MEKKFSGLMRTHNCGELNGADIGENVTLTGWVNKYRNLGGLHFIDIRDKYGVTQLAFEDFKGDISLLKNCSLESVILASGSVRSRPEEALNKKMKTGEVELQVEKLEILSRAEEPPFLPHGKVEATEDLRLKYRYIDFRTEKLQNMLTLRSQACQKVRTALYESGFTEVETPILYKSTPEGARDYVVPSRVHKGRVYALPQSPQTLKQLLMIGGTDKYFQMSRCFRDEDLRADRQPEFTQIDIEASFSTPEYIKNVAENIIINTFEMEKNFSMPMLSYKDAVDLYGSDKPDVRFGIKHIDVTELFKNSPFSTFASIANAGGLIKAIFIGEKLGTFSRKKIDALTDIVKPHGGKGVAWFKNIANERSGGISKFIDDSLVTQMEEKARKLEEAVGDGTWFFFADNDHNVAHSCADAIRRHFGKEFDLLGDGYAFLWVNDFPLLEYDKDDKRFYACHHPFTSPHPEDLDKFMSDNVEELASCRAQAYDLVCNGYEMAGGSIRIHNNKTQTQMFKVLGMEEEEIQSQFGFFIEALKYGTPPHGGIAFGFDRLMMLLAKNDNIRDVIAFPKTTSATDLMSSAPSAPSDAQIKELHFRWDK